MSMMDNSPTLVPVKICKSEREIIFPVCFHNKFIEYFLCYFSAFHEKKTQKKSAQKIIEKEREKEISPLTTKSLHERLLSVQILLDLLPHIENRTITTKRVHNEKTC